MGPPRLLLSALVLCLATAARADDGMSSVGPAVYEPFFPPTPSERAIPVAAFRIDRTPVTVALFRDFVRAHPEWRRDRIPRLFADAGYLARWPSPVDIRPGDEDRPITEVSWFAAKAYCDARGARLPTEAEWELVAMASPTQKDGRQDTAWRARILDWYARPNPSELPKVGSTPANAWGVRDMHGVVWEWVLDFNATMLTTDPRAAGEKNLLRFCGGGGLTAQDNQDYPTYMRLGFRSSLKADYTTRNLGFRCATDVAKENKP